MAKYNNGPKPPSTAAILTFDTSSKADGDHLIKKLAILGIQCHEQGDNWISLPVAEANDLKKKFQTTDLNACLTQIKQQPIVGLNATVMNKGAQQVSVIIPDVKSSARYWEKPDSTASFGLVAQQLNNYLFNVPYAEQNCNGDKLTVNQHNMWRPNHDATHGMREATIAMQLLDLIKVEGKEPFKAAATQMTAEERSLLQLAAYLDRVGRTNEESGTTDHSITPRSQEIFEKVATQLGYKQELIQDVKRVMKFGSGKETPSANGLAGDAATQKAKFTLMNQLLQAGHMSDLQRCWPATKFQKKIPSDLKDFFTTHTTGNADQHVTDTLQLAAKLAADTGNNVYANQYNRDVNENPSKRSAALSNLGGYFQKYQTDPQFRLPGSQPPIPSLTVPGSGVTKPVPASSSAPKAVPATPKPDDSVKKQSTTPNDTQEEQKKNIEKQIANIKKLADLDKQIRENPSQIAQLQAEKVTLIQAMNDLDKLLPKDFQWTLNDKVKRTVEQLEKGLQKSSSANVTADPKVIQLMINVYDQIAKVNPANPNSAYKPGFTPLDPTPGTDGRVKVQLPSPADTKSFFQNLAGKNQKFTVSDKDGNMIAYSNGDGKLRGADHNELSKNGADDWKATPNTDFNTFKPLSPNEAVTHDATQEQSKGPSSSH